MWSECGVWKVFSFFRSAPALLEGRSGSGPRTGDEERPCIRQPDRHDPRSLFPSPINSGNVPCQSVSDPASRRGPQTQTPLEGRKGEEREKRKTTTHRFLVAQFPIVVVPTARRLPFQVQHDPRRGVEDRDPVKQRHEDRERQGRRAARGV